MKNKSFKISLFYKFFVAIISIVIVFGIINISIVKNSVKNSLNTEIDKRSLLIAKTIVEQSLPNILSLNVVKLNTLINNIKDIDPSIHYIFIINGKGEVLAHSFNRKVPIELVNVNILNKDEEFKTKLLNDKDDNSIVIKDFAKVILNHNIGIVRLGIIETQIKSTINNTVNNLMIMIFLFLISGFISALLFSYLIAKPIKALSLHSDIINMENIHQGINLINSIKTSYFFKIRSLFKTEDEIDVLFDKYLLMLKRLEDNHKELTNMQMSIIQTEKMASIGTLSAGIAHEINNPIAGLKNCVRRIGEAPDNISQNIRYISLMNEALDKMQDVINRLLDFSKKDKIDFNYISIIDCIKNTLELIMYKIEFLNIELKYNYFDTTSYIYANKNQIEQVILNLVLNSIESIEEKTASTTADFKGLIEFTVKNNDNNLIFIVSDNGLGVSNSCIQSIFDPFYSVKKIKQGTGLGLAVCHNIISLHNATIEAFNNNSVGLAIKMTFKVFELNNKNN